MVDDDVGARQGIRVNLAKARVDVCGEAADAAAATERVQATYPDVCLIGLALPGGGLETAAWIRANAPKTAVLLVVDDVTDEDLAHALRIGVSGFVLRGMSGERLPHVLRSVARGEVALPRALAARVARMFREREERREVALADDQRVELTKREWEVLDLLRKGSRTREVAERLGIAQVTVRRHIGGILAKLGVESRADALALLKKRSQG